MFLEMLWKEQTSVFFSFSVTVFNVNFEPFGAACRTFRHERETEKKKEKERKRRRYYYYLESVWTYLPRHYKLIDTHNRDENEQTVAPVSRTPLWTRKTLEWVILSRPNRSVEALTCLPFLAFHAFSVRSSSSLWVFLRHYTWVKPGRQMGKLCSD